MSRSRFASWCPLVLGAALFGCSASPRPAGVDSFLAPPDGARDVQSDTDVERWFPLVDGNIYSYRTHAEDGDAGLLVLRAHRIDAAHGEMLYKNGRRKRFTYTERGVLIDGTDTFVIATPIAEGTSFRGQNGCPARIDSVGVVMDVPAGRFRDCARVVESCTGDRRVRFTTTLCPATGIIAMEAESGMSFDHAELQSLGPPLDITDGTTVIPGEDGFVPPSSSSAPPPAATGRP
ncbi:MAG: hypothetical protein U0441_38500 [Polyangiaceae bacterium]